jgi:hypothetical protein
MHPCADASVPDFKGCPPAPLPQRLLTIIGRKKFDHNVSEMRKLKRSMRTAIKKQKQRRTTASYRRRWVYRNASLKPADAVTRKHQDTLINTSCNYCDDNFVHNEAANLVDLWKMGSSSLAQQRCIGSNDVHTRSTDRQRRVHVSAWQRTTITHLVEPEIIRSTQWRPQQSALQVIRAFYIVSKVLYHLRHTSERW